MRRRSSSTNRSSSPLPNALSVKLLSHPCNSPHAINMVLMKDRGGTKVISFSFERHESVFCCSSILLQLMPSPAGFPALEVERATGGRQPWEAAVLETQRWLPGSLERLSLASFPFQA